MSGCVIYRRQSLDRTADELAISRQLTVCKRVASSRGLEVADVITDNDITASKRGRPGYNRLIRLVAAGAVDTIIILRIDRLLRLNDELEELISLVEQRGLTVITAEGEIDLSTPQGRLMARILVSVARSEMEVKGARHKLANEQRAKAGRPHAGRRAFGYETDGVTIVEHEALLLKDIAERFLSGWTYNELAMYMNAQGARTTMGNEFISVAVRQLLTRKRYVGIREYNGQEFPAEWQPIFDPETFERIQLTIKQRTETWNRPKSRKFLLTGMLECGLCGTSLIGNTAKQPRSGETYRIYRCRHQARRNPEDRGCGRVTRGAIPLEHFIKELIIYRLDSPQLADLLSAQDGSKQRAQELLNKRALLEAKMNDLVDDYADGTLSKFEFRRAKQRAQEQLEAVQDQIAALHSSDTLEGLISAGQSVRAQWEAETDGWRRAVIDLLIEKIVVNAGKKLPRVKIDGKTYYFDSELIDVVWKA